MSDEQGNRRGRLSWDFANMQFNRSKGNFADAIRAGAEVIPAEIMSLLPIERDSRLLHPMCNDGREAAYLAYKAECKVVGVDYSKSALCFARDLNDALELSNEFIEADVFDWSWSVGHVGEFEHIFISPGSLWWVDDLGEFFGRLLFLLKSGGDVIVWEFHPIVTCFEKDMTPTRDYPFNKTAIFRAGGVEDYVTRRRDFVLTARKDERVSPYEKNDHSITDFRWSLAEILSVMLIKFQLKPMEIRELDFIWEERYFAWLTEESPGCFRSPAGAASIPLSLLLICQKQ